jgi:hypothetical protein
VTDVQFPQATTARDRRDILQVQRMTRVEPHACRSDLISRVLHSS